VKIALIEGGRSLERGVSMRTSARVRESLEHLDHEVIAVEADSAMVETLRSVKPEAGFIAVHGRLGEDGTLQQALDLLGIPFTGCAPAVSRVCSDKAATKNALVKAGLPTPDSVVVDGDAVRDVGFGQLVGEIGARLGWPVVVKPATQGSSLGVTLAADAGAVPSSLLAALSYDSHALIERYVEGRDLAVAVIGNVGGEPSVLPIIEAIPEGDAYDFEARYEIGATRFECPADLPSLTTGAAEQLAIRAFEALECEGCVRVDMILDAGGELSILELDTVPGLTQTSLVPQAAQAAGMSFDQLVARMIDLALARS